MRTNKKGKTSNLKHYLAIVLLSVALLIVPLGCAHRPQVKAPPLPKFTEAELGTVAVASACFEPEFKCPHKPMTKGKAAGVGALEGFFASILGGGMTGNPLGAALGIVISPAVAAGGAIYGAIEGETTKTIRKTEETLNHSLVDLGTQGVIQEQVLSLAQKRSRCTFVVSEQSGPNVLDEETTYDSLNGKSIDTVLEISVRKFGLWREKDAIDPPLSLFMTEAPGLFESRTIQCFPTAHSDMKVWENGNLPNGLRTTPSHLGRNSIAVSGASLEGSLLNCSSINSVIPVDCGYRV